MNNTEVEMLGVIFCSEIDKYTSQVLISFYYYLLCKIVLEVQHKEILKN